MSLDVEGLIDAVASHAAEIGDLEHVAKHEPRNAPGAGLTFAVWVDRLGPVESSGLDSVSARIVLKLRIYSSADSAPADEIDPRMTRATDALIRAYVRNFTLAGQVRQVDIFGAHGIALEALAAYLEDRERGELLRVTTITLPLIVNDLWDEEE